MYQRQVFFIEHLGFCQQTDARRITFEESLVFGHIHEETYSSLGYHDILPPCDFQRLQVYFEQHLLWLEHTA
jgi:predicted ATPase